MQSERAKTRLSLLFACGKHIFFFNFSYFTCNPYFSHLDTPSECKLSAGGYFCPQCNSKYCELPVECKACGLTLASAPHLARSYHHLFPVEPFSELPFHPEDENSPCYGCQRKYVVSKDRHVRSLVKKCFKHFAHCNFYPFQIYKCGRCLQVFCVDCDIFVHETLHTCPGCASNPSTTSQIK